MNETRCEDAGVETCTSTCMYLYAYMCIYMYICVGRGYGLIVNKRFAVNCLFSFQHGTVWGYFGVFGVGGWDIFDRITHVLLPARVCVVIRGGDNM